MNDLVYDLKKFLFVMFLLWVAYHALEFYMNYRFYKKNQQEMDEGLQELGKWLKDKFGKK